MAYLLIVVASGVLAAAALMVARHIRDLRDRIEHLQVSLAAARWRADTRASALIEIAEMTCPPSTLRDARARATAALREEEGQ